MHRLCDPKLACFSMLGSKYGQRMVPKHLCTWCGNSAGHKSYVQNDSALFLMPLYFASATLTLEMYEAEPAWCGNSVSSVSLREWRAPLALLFPQLGRWLGMPLARWPEQPLAQLLAQLPGPVEMPQEQQLGQPLE